MTRSRLADAVGGALLLLVAGTLVVSAGVNGGNPWPGLAMVGLATVSYAAGRRSARLVSSMAAFALGLVVVPLLTSPFAVSAAAAGPPLGYANANAALYVQLAGLAGIAAVTARDRARRAIAAACSVVLVLATGAMHSLAAFATGVALLLALSAALARVRTPRRSVLAGAIGVVLIGTHVAVLVLGLAHRDTGSEQSRAQAAVSAAMSERRLDLWSDAARLAQQHFLTGVGPRQFPTSSPTARISSDTRQAHSETLQTAAEVGWLGAAGLLGLLVWGAARPLVAGDAGRVTPVGLVAATTAAALGLQVSIDYILQFPTLVAAAAFVVGFGTTAATTTGRAVSPRHKPDP